MINQEIDISIVKELSKRVNFNTYEISDAGLTTESDGLSSFIIPYLFLMILFMTIMMSGQLYYVLLWKKEQVELLKYYCPQLPPKNL